MSEATICQLHDQDKLLINFPNGGKWVRGYLKEVLGARVQADWIRDNDGKVWWTVAKAHREKVTEALVSLYDGVWVLRDYSTKQVCTTHCQRAKKDKCECSCGGQFHRGGGDWSYVKDDLLVGYETRRVTRYFTKEAA